MTKSEEPVSNMTRAFFFFFWGGKPTWIVPDQDKSWSREGLLEVRLCLLA